jgi:hypothetical protein
VQIWSENLQGRDNTGGLGVNGRIMMNLKETLKTGSDLWLSKLLNLDKNYMLPIILVGILGISFHQNKFHNSSVVI